MHSILPYTLVDGIPTFADSELADIYAKLVHEKVAKWLFFEGSIDSKEDFVRHVKDPRIITLVPMDNKRLPMGVIFLDGIRRNTAYIHGGFFMEYFGEPSRMSGKEIIAMAMQKFSFDVLYGLVPVINSLGVRFARDIGGHFLGRVPNATWDGINQKPVDGMLFYFNGGDSDEDL